MFCINGIGNALIILGKEQVKTMSGFEMRAQFYPLVTDLKRLKEEAAEGVPYVGHTGRATGSHLHFEAWVNGERTDAMSLLGAN